MLAFFSNELHAVYQRKFQDYEPLAIPLSEQRLAERGFNQSELLLDSWAEPHRWLKRASGTKQSKKGRHERIAGVNASPFFC